MNNKLVILGDDLSWVIWDWTPAQILICQFSPTVSAMFSTQWLSNSKYPRWKQLATDIYFVFPYLIRYLTTTTLMKSAYPMNTSINIFWIYSYAAA